MPEQPRKLYQIHADQEARKKTENLLRSREPSAPVKALVGGALAGAAFPTALTTLGVAGNLPWLYSRLAEESQIREILKARGGTRVPDDPDAARQFFEALSDNERALLKNWAAKTKFNAGPGRKVPVTELLGKAGKILKNSAGPTAAAAAVLGGVIGLAGNVHQRREANRLLQDAGIKTASAQVLSEDEGVRILQAAFNDELEKIAVTKFLRRMFGGVDEAAGAARRVDPVAQKPLGPTAAEIQRRIMAARGENVDPRTAHMLGYLDQPAQVRQMAATQSGWRRGDTTPIAGYGTGARSLPGAKTINPF